MADVTVNWTGDQAIAKARKAAADGLEDGAEHLLAESNQGVPHMEGVLETSGDLDVDRTALEASVFYDTPYAVRQHEDQSLHHGNGRHAQYLELALATNQGAILDYIAAQVRAALGG